MIYTISTIVFIFNTILHPIHNSVTNIEYFQEKKEFKITVKLYKDDFKTIIYKNYQYKLNTEQMPPSDSASFYMTDYVKRHLVFIIGKKGFNQYKLQSAQVNFEAFWLTFTLPFHKKPKSITLHNSLMNDMFADQNNLVIFSFTGKEDGYIFTHRKENITLLLK